MTGSRIEAPSSDLDTLKILAKTFPKSPGVYLMKNHAEVVIYVGKAKNLKNRVSSYFTGIKNLPSKVKHLVKKIVHIDYMVTETEVEAFLLEASLIKKYRPRYNIRLKDDKAYPYIKYTKNETYPRLLMSRKVKNDGALYFGPYISGYHVREMIQFLNQTYKVRDCSNGFMKIRKRPCLTHEIDACEAPCVDLVSKKKYTSTTLKAVKFLEGEDPKIQKLIEKKMLKAASQEDFETAAILRDRLTSIEHLMEKQIVVGSTKDADRDVLVVVEDEDSLLLEFLFYRAGRVTGFKNHFLTHRQRGVEDHDLRAWLVSFLNQYYMDQMIPKRICLPMDLGPELTALLKNVLEARLEAPVWVSAEKDQVDLKLYELCEKNALKHLSDQKNKQSQKDQGLMDIKNKLNLPDLPSRIECYDISHFQGEETVGSQVVFQEGWPSRADYRRYIIRTVKNIDDYESMREVLKRRFAHTEYNDPQMILIDGGKGQLKRALKALSEMGRSDIPVVGIAKARTQGPFSDTEVHGTQERFYLPNQLNPITFPANSEAFRILTSLRDEAHRFAITLHRKRRDEARFLSSD